MLREALSREAREAKEYAPDETVAGQDPAWLGGDLSRLGEFETYEWEEGLEEGRPVSYEPGVGFVVEGGKRLG